MARRVFIEGGQTMRDLRGNFAIGDLVRLKCGGAEMIVSETSRDLAICVWHDSQGAPHSTSYRFSLLGEATSSNFERNMSYPASGGVAS